ncbi:MAG: threonine synthase [Ancalomicrobiaceae bacterium]|nr:threonine synthase [Ancalomicrobiaceae bacterium]
MQYVSTRGEAPVLGFADVLLAGLARDGGLYVPAQWPRLAPDEIADFAGRPYADVALSIFKRFIGDDIAEADLKRMVDEAYATFRHPAVTPLTQLASDQFLLELFHGPTLAFKDVAMQVLSRLMDHVLAERGQRATIAGATSGDTGGAAIEAFRGRERVDVFILFPDGRVSDVQRRQMTTPTEDNVHSIAIRGTFDDAQALVKGLFNHHSFRDRVGLAGVNSINWARIMAQVVYYFVAGVALGAPWRQVAFTVPTGNFGDIFAGYVASRMGLPVARLVIATNVNDILHRTLQTGRYEPRGVIATSSPSMDIQVSSNFERLLFEAYLRDGAGVRRLMAAIAQSGSTALDPDAVKQIGTLFASGRTDEAETMATIADTLNETGILVDPHTATGLFQAKRHTPQGVPMVTLATAHPAKFPDAVTAAAGFRPALPAWLAHIMTAEERYAVIPADQIVLERLIEERTHSVRVGL